MVESCLWQNSDMKENPGHFPHEINNIARCIVMRCEVYRLESMWLPEP